MSPLYDFECPHGHRFEHMCTMAERNEPIPCEGSVNQLVADEIADKALEMRKRWELNPHEIAIVGDVHVTFEDIGAEEPLVVTPVSCILKAKLVVGTRCNIDHGATSNRDAAREGRYDPLNPNTRFMAKGRREWRRD